LIQLDVGGNCLTRNLVHQFQENVLKTAKKVDAVLFGAVGAPQWDGLSWEDRPEKCTVDIKKGVKLVCKFKTCLFI
jgi:Isocitrate/isopropylmalate dehydrogenase